MGNEYSTEGVASEWRVRYGTLRGQCWGADGPLILALHGWLDNSASFARLAAQMGNVRIVAPDMPGHGHSDWLAAGGDYSIWSGVEPLYDLMELLGEPVIIVGHSMGGAVGTLLAGAFSEQVKALISIDVPGPLSTSATDAPAQLAQSVRFRASGRKNHYPSAEAALQARLAHNKELSADCIGGVVMRNLQQSPEGFCWRTDSRLRAPSRVRFSEEQIAAFFAKMSMPTLFIRARNGLIPEALFRQRLAHAPAARYQELDGHHHLHLETQTVASVAASIQAFLQEVV